MGINVLSLFDGMSCGQQALERIGFDVDNYYASEIDKYAIKVTMANYPNTIQLGSVIDVDVKTLPKIDLLMGGSPCQSFSFAGKRKGMATKCETEILTLETYLQLKKDGFEFEGQSYLFWEYMRILTELREINPNIKFLLENVEMGEKWEKVLSRAIGVNGIHINSALVSAQNRKRIYWTNIGMIPGGLFGDLVSIIEQPKDKGILLKDILENEVDEKYFLSEKSITRISSYNNAEKSFDNDSKSLCLVQGYAKIGRDNTFIVHNTMPRSGDPKKGGTGHLTRNDGKTYCLDTGNTNAIEIREVKQISQNNKSNGGTQPYQQNRIYDIEGISPALSANKSDLIISLTSKDKRLRQTIDENNLVDGEVKALDTYNQSVHDIYPTLKDPKHNARALFDGSRIRRLTPIECERLQTVKDNYTNHVSDSQRYKMLGNGWTIDVICHILSYL